MNSDPFLMMNEDSGKVKMTPEQAIARVKYLACLDIAKFNRQRIKDKRGGKK